MYCNGTWNRTREKSNKRNMNFKYSRIAFRIYCVSDDTLFAHTLVTCGIFPIEIINSRDVSTHRTQKWNETKRKEKKKTYVYSIRRWRRKKAHTANTHTRAHKTKQKKALNSQTMATVVAAAPAAVAVAVCLLCVAYSHFGLVSFCFLFFSFVFLFSAQVCLCTLPMIWWPSFYRFSFFLSLAHSSYSVLTRLAIPHSICELEIASRLFQTHNRIDATNHLKWMRQSKRERERDEIYIHKCVINQTSHISIKRTLKFIDTIRRRSMHSGQPLRNPSHSLLPTAGILAASINEIHPQSADTSGDAASRNFVWDGAHRVRSMHSPSRRME